MWNLIAIPLTCWLCALLALPRKPRLGTDVEDLVYARLLGRQQRLFLLALFASAVAFITLIAHLPSTVLPDDSLAPQATQTICQSSAAGPGVCWVGQPGGVWAVERQQPDGSVLIEDYVPVPPSSTLGTTVRP
jgi:hypothetical protein